MICNNSMKYVNLLSILYYSTFNKTSIPHKVDTVSCAHSSVIFGVPYCNMILVYMLNTCALLVNHKQDRFL